MDYPVSRFVPESYCRGRLGIVSMVAVVAILRKIPACAGEVAQGGAVNGPKGWNDEAIRRPRVFLSGTLDYHRNDYRSCYPLQDSR